MADSGGESGELIDRLQQGDERALAELFAQHHARLWRMVSFRMDPRLSHRLDPDDILQEAYLNAASRLEQFFFGDSSRSAFIWLRLVVMQTLINVHRRHLGAQARDVRREVAIRGWNYPQATSTSMVAQLLGDMTSPSQAAMRAEMAERIEKALETMDAVDREVLALRHFEELTNSEVADVLKIGQKAASIRYMRALARLKAVLGREKGFFNDGSSS